MKSYIHNFSITEGYDLPGRVPGHKNSKITLLQAFQNKIYVHCEYEKACLTSIPPIKPVGYSLFCELWTSFPPYIVCARPKTDLCFTRQKGVSLVVKSQNKELEKKKDALVQHEYHLNLAAEQRQHYQNNCQLAVNNLKYSHL